VQVPYTAALTATGGTQSYSWSVVAGSLPPGLVLGGSTGAIAGTPSASGQYSFTVQVTATPSQSATKTFTLTVSPPPAVSVSISPISATVGSGGTQQFTATVLNAANAGVVWSVAGGGTISPSGLYTAPAVTASAVATVTATSVADATKSASATVAITVASARIATSLTLVPNSNPINQGAWLSLTAHLVYAGSVLPTGLITISEGPTVWNGGLTPVLDETWWTNTLPAGSHSLVANYSGDANYAASVSPVQVINVTAAAPSPLQITTSSLPGGALNVNYNATLAAANGVSPYTWSNTGGQLPPGLALQASAGQISGNPIQAGVFGFLVQAKDSSGQTASSNFSIVIAPLSAPTVGSVSPNSGSAAGGTSVTITGTNFQAGASVLFGGVAALSVTVSSATQIQAVTPAHAAAAVDVTVRNPDGQSSMLSSGFVYHNPAPTVASILPNSGSSAGGTSVSITGTNFLAGALVLFGTAPASAVTVNSGTQIQAVTPANAAGTADIVVQNPDGQSARLAGGFTYTAPAPTGAPNVASISPNSGPAGTQVTINGANFGSGATVAFGTVNAPAATFVSSTQLTVSVPAEPAGVVDVKVTNPGGSSATLSGGYAVTAPQSLLAGMTPSNFTVPAGWTLAKTQDFESGTLGANEVACGAQTSITSNNSHTGSRSLQGTYSGDGQRVCWALQKGTVNSREVYLSWYAYWEQQGRFNDEFELARFLKNDASGNLLEEVVVDQISIGNLSNPGNMTNTNLIVIPQGILSAGGFTHAYWENATNLSGGFGAWTQYEIHFKANTPGASDGVMEIYKNGSLMQQIVNANFNGTLDMTDMLVFVQDVYTKLTWLHADGSCGAYMGDGADSGPRVSDFSKPCPCPAQCPPGGSCAAFKTYIDDIIVLKK